jgi:uncharacterized protein YjbI with pentapeptide repeats
MSIETEKHRRDVHRADFTAPRFDDVSLSRCDFQNVNMSGFSLDDLKMSRWRVGNANLAGLKIEKANLAGTSFVDIRLEGATVERMVVTELAAYLRAADAAKSA